MTLSEQYLGEVGVRFQSSKARGLEAYSCKYSVNPSLR